MISLLLKRHVPASKMCLIFSRLPHFQVLFVVHLPLLSKCFSGTAQRNKNIKNIIYPILTHKNNKKILILTFYFTINSEQFSGALHLNTPAELRGSTTRL